MQPPGELGCGRTLFLANSCLGPKGYTAVHQLIGESIWMYTLKERSQPSQLAVLPTFKASSGRAPYSWSIFRKISPYKLINSGVHGCSLSCCTTLTLFPHAHLEALSEAAVLALVAVVLVDRAAPGAAALVRQVPPHGPLEKALAACKNK